MKQVRFIGTFRAWDLCNKSNQHSLGNYDVTYLYEAVLVQDIKTPLNFEKFLLCRYKSNFTKHLISQKHIHA